MANHDEDEKEAAARELLHTVNRLRERYLRAPQEQPSAEEALLWLNFMSTLELRAITVAQSTLDSFDLSALLDRSRLISAYLRRRLDLPPATEDQVAM